MKKDGSDEGDNETDASDGPDNVNEAENIKKALSLAFDAIGISAKAATDDLLSLADNEDAVNEDKGNATHRRKGLKLPAIYGSKQYESHLYLGMVEIIKDLENDETPPDLMGDDFNPIPEGFGDPFANDPNGFNPDDFNPPPSNGEVPLFSDDAFIPASTGNRPPPPPPPPGQGGRGVPPPPPPPRTNSVPGPPPNFLAQPGARTNSDAHLPGFMQDINKMRALQDAKAQIAGDQSEHGSFLDQVANKKPSGNQYMPAHMMNAKDPNESYDPYKDESLFIGSNAIKDKYNGKGGKKNLFDESAMGGGIFDQTMNQDMSMSMDQENDRNNLSKIFNTGSNLGPTKPAPVKDQIFKSGGLFDKIEEDQEEQDDDDFGSKPKKNAKLFDYNASPEKESPKKSATKNFLDDSDEEEEKIGIHAPPQPKKAPSSNMFDESIDESDSSMLFAKKPKPEAKPMVPLPGLAESNQPKKTIQPFNYGESDTKPEPPKKTAAIFDDDDENDESMFFDKQPAQKKVSTAGMFAAEDDPNESMLEASKDKSFVEKQKERNAHNPMAMLMQEMQKKNSIKKPADESRIGDSDDEEEALFVSKKEAPKQENFIQPPKQEPPKQKLPMFEEPQKKKDIKSFLDESQVESDFGSVLDNDILKKPKQETSQNKLFAEDEEEESFFFSAKKETPKPSQVSNPPQEVPQKTIKKGFMFEDDDDDDDGFLGGSNKKKAEPAPPPKVEPPKAPVVQKVEPVLPKIELPPVPAKVEAPKLQTIDPVPAKKAEPKPIDEQTQRLGFLAMLTNPNGANKPPPAFLRQDGGGSSKPQTQQPQADNLQMNKPIMKRKKKGRATMLTLDDEESKTPNLGLPSLPQQDKKRETMFDAVEKIAMPPIPEPKKVETGLPKMPELPKIEEKPAPAKLPDLPIIGAKSTPAKAPPALPTVTGTAKKGFLDDSDGDDDDDDFFSKKPSAKDRTPFSDDAPSAPLIAKKKPVFLESDDDDDNDDDDFD